MKHREINSDEAIDRVLACLREVEPLHGMQERVLRAAKERADARRRWILKLPLTATHSLALAAATVAMITLAACWTVLGDDRAIHESALSPAYLPPSNTPVAETHVVSALIASPQPANQSSTVAAKKSAASAESVSAEEALAISEMLAPSKPAPALPVTHQERMLTDVVHRGAPEELASLRPDVRAREIEIAKAEFHDFFEPPPLDPPPANAN